MLALAQARINQDRVDQVKANGDQMNDGGSSANAARDNSSQPTTDPLISAGGIRSQPEAWTQADSLPPSLLAATGPASVPDGSTPSEAGIPDNLPIPPAALNSSDPDIEAKVHQIQRLDQARSDIQGLQTDQINSFSVDSNNEWRAALLSPSEILKGLADGTATAIGLEAGPLGKAYSAGYGMVTNLAGRINDYFVDDGEAVGGSGAGRGNAAEGTEFRGKMAEGIASAGEMLAPSPEAASAEDILDGALGGSLEVYGATAAAGINATQAYNSYSEGKYLDATANAASAIGNTAKVAGRLGEVLEVSGASALKDSGEGIIAAAGFAQAGQTVVKGVSDAWESLGDLGTVEQQYSNVLSKETAVIQRLTGERNAAYLELLNLLSQKNGIAVSLPGSTPSPNAAP
jgi:hypothetical protein